MFKKIFTKFKRIFQRTVKRLFQEGRFITDFGSIKIVSDFARGKWFKPSSSIRRFCQAAVSYRKAPRSRKKSSISN